jgi:hypothetical protein
VVVCRFRRVRVVNPAKTARGLGGCRVERGWNELAAVVAYGFHRATFLGFFAAGLFFGRLGLFKDVRITTVVVSLEIVWSGLAAQIAIDALVVHVIFAAGVLGVSVRCVSHKFAFATRNMTMGRTCGKTI